jgi:hypothetical protein
MSKPAAARRYEDDEFVAQTKCYLLLQGDPEKGADNSFKDVYDEYSRGRELKAKAIKRIWVQVFGVMTQFLTSCFTVHDCAEESGDAP